MEAPGAMAPSDLHARGWEVVNRTSSGWPDGILTMRVSPARSGPTSKRAPPVSNTMSRAFEF